MLSRLLFLALFILLIDYLAWYPYSIVFGYFGAWYSWATTLYWLIPTLLILNIAGILYLRRGIPSAFTRSALLILYSTKLLTSAIWLVWSLTLAIIQWLHPGKMHALFTPALTAVAFGNTMGLLLLYGMLWNPYRYIVRRVSIPIPNLPTNLEGLKIVQISDIHSGSLRRMHAVQKGIQTINTLQADLLLFTGDLVNYTADEVSPELQNVLSQAHAKYGKFAILGNHDYGDYVAWNNKDEKTDNLHKLFQVHKNIGWTLLLNEHHTIPINGHSIAIIGVENYSTVARFQRYGNLDAATEGIPSTALRILLSHDPSHWTDQVTTPPYQNIALTLSGHTHGFQFGIEIGNWRWSPAKWLYKHWAGLYTQQNQHLYVNVGFGFLGYPGRVGILPEITLLTLTRQS
jgi:predicted MPP superfamily phosphohydrolase